MAPTVLPFQNAEQACREVLSLPGFDNWLTLRLYDHHRPAATSWWLVPTTELPAYGTGKFWFAPSRSEEGYALIGLKMEKGWGPEAKPLGVKPARIMDRRWIWHSLVSDFVSGRFLQALQEVQPSDDIRIRLSMVGPEADDDWNGRLEHDKFRWDWDSRTNRLTLVDSNAPAGYLSGVTSIDSLESFSSLLLRLSAEPTLWADLMIVSRFRLAGGASAAERRKAAEMLFEGQLKPLAHWVRKLEGQPAGRKLP